MKKIYQSQWPLVNAAKLSSMSKRISHTLLVLITSLLILATGGNVSAQILAWNPAGVAGGPSPWAPTTNVANVSSSGVTRGPNVSTNSTANTWAALGFTDGSASAA